MFRILINVKYTKLNSREIFVGALICAEKYLKDIAYKNGAWSSITKLEIKRINEIERIFLKNINYNLFVTFNDWNNFIINLNIKNIIFYLDSLQICKNLQKKNKKK